MWRFLFGVARRILQFTRDSGYGSSGTIIVLSHDFIKGFPWHLGWLLTNTIRDGDA